MTYTYDIGFSYKQFKHVHSLIARTLADTPAQSFRDGGGYALHEQSACAEPAPKKAHADGRHNEARNEN